jgi:S-adenosylmethionine-dependent methyltransferase
LTKVLSGDLDAALTELQAWIGTVSHSGHLDADELARVCAAAGLVVEQVSGVGVFSDLVALASAAPITSAGHAADLSAELEALSCTRSPLRDIASRLHVVARRPVSQS